MSLLAVRIGAGVLVLLALITLRGKRWAYFAFVLLGLLYFPAQTHFRVHVPKCEQLLPTIQLLVAVSFRPRPPGVYPGCTYLRLPLRTFHRARPLLRQRRTWLRRMRSRRRSGRRSFHAQRSCNAFGRSGDVSGRCCNACG